MDALITEREVTVEALREDGIGCVASLAGWHIRWRFEVGIGPCGWSVWFAHSTPDGWSTMLRAPNQWSSAHPTPRTQEELHRWVKWFLQPRAIIEPTNR